MAVVLVKLSLLAEKETKRMELFATHYAKLASTELDLSAGNTVPMDSVMMVLSVISLMPTDVELDTQFGMKTNVIVKIQISVAKSGEPFGTLNADQTSTMLLAVSAHPTAPLTRLTLVSHVPSNLTGVVLAMFCNANLS